MKILLIGSTGMLGQALNKKMSENNHEVVTVARSNSNYNIDLLLDGAKLIDIINNEKPDVVINSAAMINLKKCEEHPDQAFLLNTRIPSLIEFACRKIECFFVQISTDHYYTNDARSRHGETEGIILLNEYARTKYAGECIALTYENSLVIRTNIVGFRNKKNEPTFIEWIIKSLQANMTITGYNDFYTSSIDVYHFSNILMELIEKRVTGIVNVASTDVWSKFEFIYEFAKALGKERLVLSGEMDQSSLQRANSLGLDTNKLKGTLSRQEIPSSKKIIELLVEKYKEGACHELS